MTPPLDIGHATVRLTILVGGKPYPSAWRMWLFGRLAKLLRIPFDVVASG